MTAEKCAWCKTDKASEFHSVELFGRRFLLCEDCFSVTWALAQRLVRIRQEFGRRHGAFVNR